MATLLPFSGTAGRLRCGAGEVHGHGCVHIGYDVCFIYVYFMYSNQYCDVVSGVSCTVVYREARVSYGTRLAGHVR